MNKDILLIKPDYKQKNYINISPKIASWKYLKFSVSKIKKKGVWEYHTKEEEMCIVVLGGTCSVKSSVGNWKEIGQRADVFSGMTHCLYLPRRTSFTLSATSDLEIAYGSCPANSDHPPALITPKDIKVFIKGSGNFTRQVNPLIPPGFDCSRLVVSETYTPSGNWSSYPPHKHDQLKQISDGSILEAELEETYYFKFKPANGFAFQHVYTKDRSVDQTLYIENNNLVLVPKGYHPVAHAPGYTTYYLNFLAGPTQSLANSEDPDFKLDKDVLKQEVDPRVPLVSCK